MIFGLGTRWGVLLLVLLCFQTSLSAEDCGLTVPNWDRPTILSSGWAFRNGDSLEYKEPDIEEGAWSRRNLPDYSSTKIPGYVWYRCSFFLPETFPFPTEPIAIHFGQIRDADEFYFNGFLIQKTGTLSDKPEIDFQKQRIYPIPNHFLQPGKNTIAIRIYAATSISGFKTSPVIYTERVLKENLFVKEILAIICGYVFIFMGIYFIVGSVVKGRAHENFFFAFFSLFMGVYALLRTQHREVLFSNFSTSYIVELLLLVSLPVLFLNFLYSYLKANRSKILVFYEVYLGVLFIILLFFRNPKTWFLVIELFNYSLPMALFLVGMIFYKHGKKELKRLRFILLGILLLLPTIVIDSLTALEWIQFPGTLYFGFLLFLFMISLQLSEDMVHGLQLYLAQEKELIQMEKIKTGFLVNISLEFKSGMEKIYLALDKIARTQSKASQALLENIKTAEEHISTMHYMVREAILLKQLEEGSYALKLSPVSMAPFTLSCLQSVETHLGQNRKKKSISIQPKELVLEIDEELIFAALRNLIENAYIYTASDKEVTIQITQSDSHYEILVADDGMGLSQIEMQTIFQKFVRSYSESKQEIPGAGIGLTLVKSIVNFLGGTVQLKSQEGMGAKFILQIPIAKGKP